MVLHFLRHLHDAPPIPAPTYHALTTTQLVQRYITVSQIRTDQEPHQKDSYCVLGALPYNNPGGAHVGT